MKAKSAARGLAVGDLFNDGNLDAVVENLDGAPTILRSHGAAGRHWISFELAGTSSNRSAIGAELKLTSAGVIQTEEIRSGGSYLSQSDLRAHFGLAKATIAEEVEIRWPSGRRDILHKLAADLFYMVLEGVGIVERSRILPSARTMSHVLVKRD